MCGIYFKMKIKYKKQPQNLESQRIPKKPQVSNTKKGKKIVALATKQGKQLDWETRWCRTMSEKEARAGTVPHTPTRVALVNLA